MNYVILGAVALFALVMGVSIARSALEDKKVKVLVKECKDLISELNTPENRKRTSLNDRNLILAMRTLPDSASLRDWLARKETLLGVYSRVVKKE